MGIGIQFLFSITALHRYLITSYQHELIKPGRSNRAYGNRN